MNKILGKVVEVFIPKEYKNNELIDIMSSDKIGFKVMLDETAEVINIILEQDEDTADIYRDDMVILIKDNNTNQFIDIEIYNGDEYE